MHVCETCLLNVIQYENVSSAVAVIIRVLYNIKGIQIQISVQMLIWTAQFYITCLKIPISLMNVTFN